MKLKDLVAKCDKSVPGDINLEDLYEELFSKHPDEPCVDKHPRLTSFYLGRHYCTDTWVGIQVYYLDDKPVCVTEQSARKSDKHYQWISQQAAQKTRDYLKELFPDPPLKACLWDPQREMGLGYPVDYPGQFLDKKILYKGEEVTLVDQSETAPDGKMNFEWITVQTRGGKVLSVLTTDCVVPWKVK